MPITKENFCKFINDLEKRITTHRDNVRQLYKMNVHVGCDECEFLFGDAIRFLQAVMCERKQYIFYYFELKAHPVEELIPDIQDELGPDALSITLCQTPESLYDLIKERFSS